MPRYFFNIYDGKTIIDDEGTELPDIYRAQEEAIRVTSEVLRDVGANFWNGMLWRLEVVDEKNNILFILRFSAEETAGP